MIWFSFSALFPGRAGDRQPLCLFREGTAIPMLHQRCWRVPAWYFSPKLCFERWPLRPIPSSIICRLIQSLPFPLCATGTHPLYARGRACGHLRATPEEYRPVGLRDGREFKLAMQIFRKAGFDPGWILNSSRYSPWQKPGLFHWPGWSSGLIYSRVHLHWPPGWLPAFFPTLTKGLHFSLLMQRAQRLHFQV